MAWKQNYTVVAKCPKCEAVKTTKVHARRDEVSHKCWNIGYCETCEQWHNNIKVCLTSEVKPQTERIVENGISA